MIQKIWKDSLTEGQRLLTQFLADPAQLSRCEDFTRLLTNLYRASGNLFVCGNGGSHCDANHFAEELTGRFRGERRPLGALALGEASHLTCVSNDYGFEQVFARQLEGLGRAGDLLVGISTSGNSENVILAVEVAKRKKIKAVALLGRDGGKLRGLVDLAIVIPGETSDRVQEMHIKIIHTVIEACERELFPANYSGN